MKDQPLKVSVETDELVIRIGVDVLAFSFEEGEQNNPFDAEKNDFKRDCHVVDKQQFAQDVKRAVCDEAEDGSTPLTRFLDDMYQDAANDGSLGIELYD